MRGEREPWLPKICKLGAGAARLSPNAASAAQAYIFWSSLQIRWHLVGAQGPNVRLHLDSDLVAFECMLSRLLSLSFF